MAIRDRPLCQTWPLAVSQSTMASLRALNLTSRGRGFTSGLFRAAVSRLMSTKPMNILIPGVFYITPFERAMQDVHGDQWKERLRPKQKSFVQFKERERAQKAEASGFGQSARLARDDEYSDAWHEKVRNYRDLFLAMRQGSGTGERVEPEAEQPGSQA